MYHSLTIKTFPSRGTGSLTFNTFNDFYLVPTSLPIISTPGIKTKSVDIPGANGAIDLTESLTPYPLYNNRTGSLEFALLNNRDELYTRYNAIYDMNSNFRLDSPNMWAQIYSEIANKIHGRKCQIILEDDPNWYYEGRIALNQWASSNDGKWPIITFNYDLAPYKLSVFTSTEGISISGTDRWKWSPFSFIDGVIPTGLDIPTNFSSDGVWKDIIVDSDSYNTYGVIENNLIVMNRNFTGWMPVNPEITIKANSTNMGIKIVNSELGYEYDRTFPTNTSDKKYIDPELLLYDYLGDGYVLQLKGHGTLSVEFRKGSL